MWWKTKCIGKFKIVKDLRVCTNKWAWFAFYLKKNPNSPWLPTKLYMTNLALLSRHTGLLSVLEYIWFFPTLKPLLALFYAYNNPAFKHESQGLRKSFLPCVSPASISKSLEVLSKSENVLLPHWSQQIHPLFSSLILLTARHSARHWEVSGDEDGHTVLVEFIV